MEFEGTKGVWRVVDFGNEIIVQSDNQDHIVTIRRTSTTRADKLYNAHLIAAAPEMLDVLMKIQKAINLMDYATIEGLYNEVEESINKALNK